MKKIKKIATGAISRNIKLLSIGLSSGRTLLNNKDLELKDMVQDSIKEQAHKFVNEFGMLKGPVMKLGQILSLYGIDFLPPQLQKALRELEDKSFYLSWEEIKKNIPLDYFNQLDFEEEALAAASLGQVHIAYEKSSKQKLAIKIQYRGVRKAIDNDLKMLKLFIKMGKYVDKKKDLSGVFAEVKSMLYQETDYSLEIANQIKFSELVDPKYFIVPKSFQEYSNDIILTSEFIDGYNLRDLPESMPQEERDKLGEAFFELFLQEILAWKLVQTDAHPGNYFIQKVDESYKWVLIDFGATKAINEETHELYKKLLIAIYKNDLELFITILKEQNFIKEDCNNDFSLIKKYLETLHSPFRAGGYNWANSTITDEILSYVPQILKEFASDNPPSKGLFIDRKIAGVFFILKIIKAEFDPSHLMDKYLN